ncbi:MAG: hypothetical protein LAO21_09750 [Acidobacteriia bacterium]|nr:hypothetical protein [Terriglobia bacterium]
MPDLFPVADHLLSQLIEQQRAKVMLLARSLNSSLTFEDLLNPQTFPELAANPAFNYEDGILAGLLSAQMALRAESRRQPPSQESRAAG